MGARLAGPRRPAHTELRIWHKRLKTITEEDQKEEEDAQNKKGAKNTSGKRKAPGGDDDEVVLPLETPDDQYLDLSFDSTKQ